MSFVRKARKGKKMLGELLREAKVWFSVFSSERFHSTNSMVMINMKQDKSHRNLKTLHLEETSTPEQTR